MSVNRHYDLLFGLGKEDHELEKDGKTFGGGIRDDKNFKEVKASRSTAVNDNGTKVINSVTDYLLRMATLRITGIY